MLPKVGQEQAREALRHALARRGASPIGTPLQEIYAQQYAVPTRVTAVTFWGAQMHVVLPELVSCEIHEHGQIEAALTALFIELVSAGIVVYDVGAHLGYHSTLASALGGKVHAFEPSKSTLPILRTNVPDDVTVAATALWDEVTTLQFKDFGELHSAVNTFLAPKDDAVAEPEEIYPVSVTTLDRYVEETGEIPGLIKVDAEGAELQVLQGSVATMRAHRPYLTIEVGDTSQEQTSRRALDFALACGYVPYELTESGLRAHAVRDVYSYGNVVLVPRGTEPPPLPGVAPT